MVYESDFYTTRRPYSSSRPYVSSYNVTPLHGPFYLYTPTYTNLVRALPVTSIHPHLPYIAHKRLVTITHSPVRIYHRGTYLPLKLHARVRPSIIAAELNRIRYLTRPSTVSHLEHYLQSKDYIDFDDETREIRAKTDSLLRKIHTFVPRPVLSDYDETSPERLRSDDYVRRIINAKNARKDIESLPWYETPEKHRDIGAGHLACVKYAGGRPQSRRRPYYTVGDLVPGDVKSDVNLMSFYIKNRKAAEDASPSSEHRREYNKEAEDAPAPSVTWADEVIHEEEPAVKQQQQQQQEQEVTVEVQQTEPEIECKAEKKKKKEKKAKAEESAENGELEAEYDENGVKKQPDEDTIKKVQDYIEKKTAEKKIEEERRAWEAAEAKRIAEEKEIARLAILLEEEERRQAEIAEQERLEAERQEVIRRAEEAQAEAARLVEDEKLYNEAIAQAIADEQERVAREIEREEQQKKEQEDEEEKMVNVVEGTNGISNEVAVDEGPVDEHSHHDLSDQEIEAKPYEVDNDEDTQIEEDVHEEPEEIENPFSDEEGEGAAAPAQADEPIEDEPQVTVTKRKAAGGEQGFDWSDYESSEPAAEETVQETQAAEVEEETPAGQPQVFDEAEVSSQADVEEAQVEETATTEETQVEETDEAQVEETQETEEAPETTEEVQIEEAPATEEAEAEEAQATEEVEQAEDEEEKSAHASEEEEEEE